MAFLVAFAKAFVFALCVQAVTVSAVSLSIPPSKKTKVDLDDKIFTEESEPDFGICGIADSFSKPQGRKPGLIGGLHDGLIPKIYQGTDADKGAWPWMAYLYSNSTNAFFCGGTLISKQWVVTAASCILSPNSMEDYRVILGKHESFLPTTLDEQEFAVEAIFRHNAFNSLSLDNDIALLKLERPAQFTPFVRPVCLPEQGFPTDNTHEELFNGEYKTYAGQVCTAIGWGTTEKLRQANALQELRMTIYPRLLCVYITARDEESTYSSGVTNDDSKFCAGNTKREGDTCNGDSGGPLLCTGKNGRYVMHGITSYGTKECNSGSPTVFTKVSDYIDWMNEIMKGN